MPKGETPTIDRGVEGPPTETENQLLKGLIELDALRARGDASAVRQFLASRPDVQALYDARQKIMKTGVLTPTAAETHHAPEAVQEQELEKVHKQLVEAWNSAEDAFARARSGGASQDKSYEIFDQTLKQALGDELAKTINVQWEQGVFATVEYKGKVFIFTLVSRVDMNGVNFELLFDRSPQPRGERYRISHAATVLDKLNALILRGELKLQQLDEHEVIKGKME